MVNIVFDYGDTVQEDIDTYGATFDDAKSFWESKLIGYRDTGFGAPTQVLIGVALEAIDGVGGTLGSAGPIIANSSGSFAETTAGSMSFDTADLVSLQSSGRFGTVIRHEMAHVLGFGTLWSGLAAIGLNGYQEVYTSGTGQYTGSGALAAFQQEFGQPDATFVPVELDGGAGTANGHWNMGQDLGTAEVADSRDDPGDAVVYTSVNNGLNLSGELMTGFLTGSAWLSNTTLQSFHDIGYQVVPEPASFALVASLVGLLSLQRRRGRSLRY
jgi:hypothetical protein